MRRLLPPLLALGVLAAATACSAEDPCVTSGKAACAAICACGEGPQCVVTSTNTPTMEDPARPLVVYEDLEDCEVLVELVCLAQPDRDFAPCDAALPSSSCVQAFEEEDRAQEEPISGLALAPACR